MNEAWEKLWALATGDIGAGATIRATAQLGQVVLVRPDGSSVWLEWDGDDWQCSGEV
jgi:hypothetical protein